MKIISDVIRCVVSKEELPEWSNLVPDCSKDFLSSKRKIKKLIEDLAKLSENYVEEDLNCVLAFIDGENQIESLLGGNDDIPVLDEKLIDLKLKLGEIFEEGFELLRRTGLRDKHYKAIYNALRSKTCPFCGYMPLDADGLKSEDLDHYLDRLSYVTAAANLHNLVPTCSKCNSRYKGSSNIILNDDGARRKAFRPYGDEHGDICLRGSDPLGGESSSPQWNIELVPDCEETKTWDAVYDVRNRLLKSCLNSNYEKTLNELIDFYGEKNLYTNCSSNELEEVLRQFYEYKHNNREQGLGFVKDKIVDVFLFRLEQGDRSIEHMIRAALRKPPQEQVA